MNPAARRARGRAKQAGSVAVDSGAVSSRDVALFFAALLTLATIVYSPALTGPFVSDDNIYLPFNPWVQEISLENIGAMFDPSSSNNLVTANYAPTQMLFHMGQWAIFGPDTLGYHLTNLLLHALCGVLFAALLLRSGAPRLAACLAAALLLFHPASAEVVSWISQLKTLLAMALALAALLLRERSPAIAAGLFLLGLFAKPIAAVALIFLLAEEWMRHGHDPARKLDRASVISWSTALAGFGAVALLAYRAANVGIEPASDDAWIQFLASASFGARYLAMAVTTYGVSPFQEPPIPEGFLDPWVWLALPCGSLLFARVVIAGRERLPEFPYWLWAAAAFVPVSQIVPFRYPMADRYLYFILPGLLGGAWFAATTQWQRIPQAHRNAARNCALAAALVFLAGFCVQSHFRAMLWVSNSAPTLAAIERWPDGAQAHRHHGQALLYNGRWEEGLAELSIAAERRVLTLSHVLQDSILGPLMGDSRFQPFVRTLARREIELLTANPQSTEYGWIRLAQAQLVNRDYADAAISLAEARKLDGQYLRMIEELEALALRRQPLVPGTQPR